MLQSEIGEKIGSVDEASTYIISGTLLNAIKYCLQCINPVAGDDSVELTPMGASGTSIKLKSGIGLPIGTEKGDVLWFDGEKWVILKPPTSGNYPQLLAITGDHVVYWLESNTCA